MKQYWKEIIILLMAKSILLFTLWYFCFSKPLKLDDETTAAHVFTTTGGGNYGNAN